MVFLGTTLFKFHVFLRWENHPHDMPSWIFQKFCTLWCHSFSACFHEIIEFMVFLGTLFKFHVFLRWENHPHDMPSWIFQKFCTLWCHSFSAYFHETIEFRQSFLTLFFLLTMPSLNSCCLEKFSRLFVLIHDGILGFMYQVGLFTVMLRLQVWENSSNEGSIILSYGLLSSVSQVIQFHKYI